MASPKAASRTLYLDTLSAQREVEVLTSKIDRLDKKIQEGQVQGKKMTKELADLDKAKAALTTVQNQIDKGLKPSLKQLEDFARRTNNELKRLSQSDPEFQNKIRQYQDAQSQIRTLKGEINGVAQAQNSWLSQIKSFGAGFLGGIVASFSADAIIGFFSSAVEEITQAELSAARFEAKLRNIGRLDVLPRLTREAQDLAAKFRFLDNDDIINVFSKLIDYGKLTEDQIKKITPVIIDFAANQRISLEESSSVIIKALEGNGKALKEYGITIKDAKDESEAFGIIMEQLAPKVEGAAETFGTTLAGQAAIAKQGIADLKEEIGENLIPVTKEWYTLLAETTQLIKDLFVPGGYANTNKKIDEEIGRLQRQALGGRLPNESVSIFTNRLSDFGVNDLSPELFKNASASSLDNSPLGVSSSSDKEKSKSKSSSSPKVQDNPRFKLLRDLKQLEEEVALLGKSNDEKELLRIINKYNKLIEEAKNYTDIVVRLETAKNKEVAFFIEQITKRQQEEQKKQESAEAEKTKKLFQELDKRKERELKVAAETGKSEKLKQAERDIENAKIGVLNSKNAKQRLDANLVLLEAEKNQAVLYAIEKEQSVELVEKEFQRKKFELQVLYYSQLIDGVLQYTQQILGVLDQLNQAQTTRENAKLEKELRQNDQRRASYKRMLDSRLISEAEYNRKVQSLNEEDDRKKKELQKKQFERNKRIQAAQAITNGLQAITRTLADFGAPVPPNFLAIIAMGLTIATNVATVASILKQKPPEFERGGIAKGGRHSEGGIDMIDRRSGRRVGNMEGGEPYMILSRNTYANNGDIIDELLDSSMNRNGERINPARIRRFWENRTYQSVNYSGASKALRTRYFENGGVVDTSSSAAANEDQLIRLERLEQVMLYMTDTVANLNRTLSFGIEANVSLKKIRDAETLDTQIQKDSTFKP